MISDIYFNSDGTIDSYTPEGIKSKDYSGDWNLIHEILHNYDICLNGSPSSLRSELRIAQTPNFYFRIGNTSEVVNIPYRHLQELAKFVVNDPMNLTGVVYKSNRSAPKPERSTSKKKTKAPVKPKSNN